MSMIYDYYDDNGSLLRRVFADKGVPAVINSAANLNNSITKHAADYALVLDSPFGVEYKYPLVDAGNTIASAVYIAEYGHALPDNLRKEASAKILTALAGYGFSAPEELTKSAALELGYSGDGDEMALEKLFGVNDGLEVLDKAFAGTTPRGKRRMMLQVKEAGVKTSSAMEDYARDGLGTDLEVAFASRKLCVPETDQHRRLDELQKTASELPPGDLVDAIESFDVDNQLVHLYGKFFPDPVKSVYGTTFAKTASESVSFRGEDVEPEEFQRLMEDKYDRLIESFGKESADQLVSDSVAVYSSLPMPQKRAIESLYE